jgi:hypothetical protein
MGIGNIQAGTSSGPITSSKAVKADQGVLIGILISSATSGTIKAWDNPTAGSGTVLFDTTAALTLTAPLYVPVNMAFATGLFLTIGGTISCAAVYA